MNPQVNAYDANTPARILEPICQPIASTTRILDIPSPVDSGM